MEFDEYLNLYQEYLTNRFADDPATREDSLNDMVAYDPDEWDYRGAFRKYLTDHPTIEFRECELSGSQGVCVKAGTFCDHLITTHNNTYVQN